MLGKTSIETNSMNDQEEDSLENLINVMTLLLSEYCFIQGLFGEVICYVYGV